MPQFKATIVIGRFQPFHKGHLSLIRKAMSLASHTFVLLGSDNNTRTPKNAWTTEERLTMMKPCFPPEELARLTFLPLKDFPDDKDWIRHIHTTLSPHLPKTGKIALVGYFKDSSSYYLRIFPEWHFIEADKFCDGLSATDLRHSYFAGLPPDPVYLPDPVIEFLCDFRKNPAYKQIQDMMSEVSSCQTGTHGQL